MCKVDLVFHLQDNYEQPTTNVGIVDPESSEIRRFELLRNELIELEERVQRSAHQSENDEVCPETQELMVLCAFKIVN